MLDHTALNQKEKDLAWSGETVKAIKSLRSRTNEGVKDCHWAVVSWLRIESAAHNKKIKG